MTRHTHPWRFRCPGTQKSSEAMLWFKQHWNKLPPLHVLLGVSQRNSSEALPTSLREALKIKTKPPETQAKKPQNHFEAQGFKLNSSAGKNKTSEWKGKPKPRACQQSAYFNSQELSLMLLVPQSYFPRFGLLGAQCARQTWRNDVGKTDLKWLHYV